MDFYELIDKNCSNANFDFNNNNNNQRDQRDSLINKPLRVTFGMDENVNINNTNNLENNKDNNFSDNNNNKITDYTDSLSHISILNTKDFFEDLNLKSKKKSNEIKEKIDNYFTDMKKIMQKRQRNLNEKINNFFEKINNKVNAYISIPMDLTQMAENWKNNVKNYFDLFNEIGEKDDVIFKLIESKVNSPEFINNAEQIYEEYLKLKNFPFKEINEILEKVNVDFEILEDGSIIANNVNLNGNDNNNNNSGNCNNDKNDLERKGNLRFK